MNLKLIDAAIAAYADKLDDADAARLAFFRALWDVQAACAAEAPAPVAWEAPAPSDIRAAYEDARPVLGIAPVVVDADALAAALGKLAGVFADAGGFPDSVVAAFARVKWDRVVRASDLALAGSDPSAWLADFAAVLADDGMAEDQAHLGALAASLALKVQLERPAQAALGALRAAGAAEPHPLLCPVCGSAPHLAHVGGTTSSAGRGRVLVCPQCAASWEFERVRCARCGTRNQAHLHFFNVEGDDAHRLATCDECGGYIRTLYSEDALAPCSYEVEDVVMARLDAIAQDPGREGER
ncbi:MULTISPECIES: formate dehydrogenase accessory protein FdhE [unclassified Adlercreutzia]|uniref:formate dehydrogenase accessory protein FdhE n=1 Tax=unclassified Adlercreutzia TaxID=2636013 RepID=UPI0013EC619F|nr:MULTISPECIES: formate dehydrogenase accessory protein FdhE [unclassified Adlercreutzia]